MLRGRKSRPAGTRDRLRRRALACALVLTALGGAVLAVSRDGEAPRRELRNEAAIAPSAAARVAEVVDGDTIELTDGRLVRLVQIDTPELDERECYARRAAGTLAAILPPRTGVRLERDPRLDRVDRYGRLLRYVFKRTTNVNVALVRRGAATVWFYGGERGSYARQLVRAARGARADERGLWGSCRRARFDPEKPASTGVQTPSRRRGSRPARCDASYPGTCIPPYPPDLDCDQVTPSSFRVRAPDPHGFDRDGNGRGCESGA